MTILPISTSLFQPELVPISPEESLGGAAAVLGPGMGPAPPGAAGVKQSSSCCPEAGKEQARVTLPAQPPVFLSSPPVPLLPLSGDMR